MEVIELKPGTPEAIIAAVEALLEDAKAGRVHALAYVGICPNQDTFCNVVWEPGRAGAMLLGGSVFLQDRIKNDILAGQ